ncbi:MAG: hypothetical protein OEY79_02585 [Anaplasmataceae bacterium]|nr:hypothetical protein [Anaplasmataceae bacterium]
MARGSESLREKEKKYQKINERYKKISDNPSSSDEHAANHDKLLAEIKTERDKLLAEISIMKTNHLGDSGFLFLGIAVSAMLTCGIIVLKFPNFFKDISGNPIKHGGTVAMLTITSLLILATIIFSLYNIASFYNIAREEFRAKILIVEPETSHNSHSGHGYTGGAAPSNAVVTDNSDSIEKASQPNNSLY